VIGRDEAWVPLESFDGRGHPEQVLSVEDRELRTLTVEDEVAAHTFRSIVEERSKLLEEFNDLASLDVRHEVGRSAVLQIAAPDQGAVGPERDAEWKRFGRLRCPRHRQVVAAFDVETSDRRLTGARMERDVRLERISAKRGVTRECNEESEAQPRSFSRQPHPILTP
jgi:hypothetical protein